MRVSITLPRSGQLEDFVQSLVAPYVAKLLHVLCYTGSKDKRPIYFLAAPQPLNEPVRNPCKERPLRLVHSEEDIVPLSRLVISKVATSEMRRPV